MDLLLVSLGLIFLTLANVALALLGIQFILLKNKIAVAYYKSAWCWTVVWMLILFYLEAGFILYLPFVIPAPLINLYLTWKNNKHKTLRGIVSGLSRNGIEGPEIIFELFEEIYNIFIHPIVWHAGLTERQYPVPTYKRTRANKLLWAYENSGDQTALEKFFDTILECDFKVNSFGVSKKILEEFNTY